MSAADPPSPPSSPPRASLVAGVDVGGTNMQFGVLDDGDRLVGRARGKTRPERGLEAVVAAIADGVRGACDEAGVDLGSIACVGVAMAGAMDIPRGVVLESPNLGLTDVPLRDLLAERLGRPVVLDNDVNGAVWGEHRLGAGRGANDALGVWVGTGVGGGLVLGGALHHGPMFTAGEIGHTVVVPDAPAGERTVEDLCSRTGLRRCIGRGLAAHPDSRFHRLAGGDPERLRTADLAEAHQAQDALAREVIDRAADLLGVAIANAVTLLAIDTVIVGGGVTEQLGRPFLDRITGRFRAEVFPPRCRECRVVMTALGPDAGLLGAALLAREGRE